MLFIRKVELIMTKSGFYATACMVTDAENADTVERIVFGDEASNFAAANIQRADDLIL